MRLDLEVQAAVQRAIFCERQQCGKVLDAARAVLLTDGLKDGVMCWDCWKSLADPARTKLHQTDGLRVLIGRKPKA